MRRTLIDLTRHCIWADDRLWRAVLDHSGARLDAAILERFHHIHLVQYVFVSIVRDEAVDPEKGRDLGIEELREWGLASAITLHELARLIPDDELEVHFEVPWFRDPPIEISRGEAILQACMHSAHHRGQNAARLRELGGEPPILDYIYWIWKGRPDPQ